MRFFLFLAACTCVYAQTCTYSASPNGFVTGAGSGGNGLVDKFTVSTQSTCTWTATSNVPWIHITNAQNYFGTASVTFSLDQNTSQQIRKGTITVGDSATQATVQFTQIAGDCNYQIPPPTSGSFPVTGGSGTFQVTAGCAWTATPNLQWMSITSTSASVLGNGTVTFSVAGNSCVSSRTGIITVNTGTTTPPPPTFSVQQDGSPSNLQFSPATTTFGASATNARVAVNTGDGCTWNSFSDAGWLQITGNSATGTGAGFITFSLSQNVGPTRTAHLTIGAQTFTVTQNGMTPPAPVLTTIINSASGATGPISPGEIISLFGTNMGPTTGVPFGTTILKSLGEVAVLFGNTPAPLTYVSDKQINAIVPFGVAPGGTVPVQVQYSGQTSNALTANVQAATPAIFSIDYSGHGPGAILNSDYKQNSVSNPAPIGSVVMVYGTGGGATNPASVDATAAPSAEPFARLALPVTATIGGIPAQVSYSGGSPGLVEGLVQFNLVVPQGVVPGSSVPLVLQVGGVNTQSGITIAVR